MNSQHSSVKSSASVRRGPTLRGGRFRPAIGRSVRVPHQQSSCDEDDEEERIGLTKAAASDSDNEKSYFETIEDIGVEYSEKLETDTQDKPVYHHGEETFGDILTNPKEELHAHRVRKQSFKAKMNRWSVHHSSDNAEAPTSSLAPALPEIHYTLVLHFRQLRGNQRFVLDHDVAVDFCTRLNLTHQEKIQFNGVHDTDGLTEFLYKVKKDFSIKIHHKGEFKRGESLDHHHHPDNHIIEINDNVYIEFKPKHDHHMDILPVEATRRPFFQHPEPDLSADIGEEKAASWLELFYDLFFVATLTQFTHSHHIKDWDSLALYAQWFIIAWWSWCASSLYTSRFDTDDVVHHIYKLIEMCAVIGMAGSSEYFTDSSGYIYGYIALKAVLAVEYFVVFIVALLAKSKSRIALAFYVGANLLSIALWASSLSILEKGTHRILWYLGVLSEVLVNVIVRGDKTLSWAASHLAERLGLLSLIVLGENLMGLVGLVSNAGNYTIIVIPNFMAVLIIFGFFFMYFEDFNKEVFLHNKYHQVWVYLHFPLHLCQVAFGISLIDILKIYKFQLIRDNKLPQDNASTNDAHGSTGTTHASTSSEHPTPEHPTSSADSAKGHSSTSTETPSNGHSESADSTEGHSSTSTEAPSNGHSESASEPAHHKAKRAILMISKEYTNQKTENYYNPMEMAQLLQQEQEKSSLTHSPTTTDNWAAWCKYFATSLAVGAMQMIAYNDNNAVSSGQHHLTRRGEPAAALGENLMTKDEVSFVYKTFLIFAGLILVINSVIKALNTKISDIYGKVIIGSRLLNAVILWSLCALPFAKLDAIVLLCTLVGSLIFQALVDLLD